MPETESSPFDILDRVKGIVIRQRWRILLSAAVVSLGTVAALYRLPNRYTSEATLIVVPQQVPARYVTPTTETNIADALQAMTQDVLSRARLLELIDEFGLYTRERQRLAPEEVLDLMRKNIEIKPADPTPEHPDRKDINSFRISFAAEKAPLAQQVTSKLTSFFIQANLKTREDQATNTTNFLEAQLEAAKSRLAVQETKLRDFKTQYLGELPEQLQGNLAIFNGAQLQLQNIEGSLDRAQQQRVYLESLISGYQRLAAERGISVAEIRGVENNRQPPTPLETAQSDLARLQAERTRLVNIYKSSYPGVVEIDRAIASDRAIIESLGASATSKPDAHDLGPTSPAPGVEAARTTPVQPGDDTAITQLKSQLEANRLDIENLTKAEAQEKTVITQYQNRLNLTPVREQELAAILRDEELSKKDYADLLDKEQQSQLATSLEKQQGGEQFRLVEPPSLPDLPSSPKRLKFSLMGIGGGLALGLVIALITELASPTLRTTTEVSKHFGAPLVIGLPVVLTQSEKRRRRWKNAFEWICGPLVASAIGLAELYVFWHP
jgi:succinoglycan biosynthesis transport protein ExoP